MTEFSRERLHLHYQRVKKDPSIVLINELGGMIKEFIDAGLNEIRISARQEYHKGVTWRYYINGLSHPLIDLLGFCILPSGEDNSAFHLNPEETNEHTLCLSNPGNHLVVLRCDWCGQYQHVTLTERELLPPCKKPLIHYLMKDLNIEITARERKRDPMCVESSLLSVDITLSWRHWI